MKFVCRSCEDYMSFSAVEGVAQDSLGVTFACPKCGARFSMVTNPGETQMVKALGVQLGGRSEAAPPLEVTRATLAAAQPLPPAPAVPAATARAASMTETLKKSMGKCPFANALAGMPMPAKEEPSDGLAWSPEARERLEKVPEFVRPFAKTMIEQLAREAGKNLVDGSIMDSAKTKFM